MRTKLKPMMSSAKTGGSDAWQTPDNVLQLVRQVGPIVLDPCTTKLNPTGAQYIVTVVDDGLLGNWDLGGLVYVNPPYSAVRAWMACCREEAHVGAEIIALVPARTDTRWFQDNCAPPLSSAVCFWRGRLKFVGAPQSAPFPSALVYWGPRADLFCGIFYTKGRIWRA